MEAPGSECGDLKKAPWTGQMVSRESHLRTGFGGWWLRRDGVGVAHATDRKIAPTQKRARQHVTADTPQGGRRGEETGKTDQGQCGPREMTREKREREKRDVHAN